MSDDLKILVIDESAVRADILKEGLYDAGHTRVDWISDTVNLNERIAVIAPDVVLIDLENPNREALEEMFQLCREVKRPIAMFVDKSDTSMIAASVDAGVSAYIVDGLKKERIKPILDMAVSRFNVFTKLQTELTDTRAALEERKSIDRAKGILMKQKSITEDEAYSLLRNAAMNQKRKIADIAISVVSAADVLK